MLQRNDKLPLRFDIGAVEGPEVCFIACILVRMGEDVQVSSDLQLVQKDQNDCCDGVQADTLDVDELLSVCLRC